MFCINRQSTIRLLTSKIILLVSTGLMLIQNSRSQLGTNIIMQPKAHHILIMDLCQGNTAILMLSNFHQKHKSSLKNNRKRRMRNTKCLFKISTSWRKIRMDRQRKNSNLWLTMISRSLRHTSKNAKENNSSSHMFMMRMEGNLVLTKINTYRICKPSKYYSTNNMLTQIKFNRIDEIW